MAINPQRPGGYAAAWFGRAVDEALQPFFVLQVKEDEFLYFFQKNTTLLLVCKSWLRFKSQHPMIELFSEGLFFSQATLPKSFSRRT